MSAGSESAAGEGRRTGVRSICLALCVLAALAALTHRGIQGQNVLSRLVGVDSLVLHGRWHVDDSPFVRAIVERDGVPQRYLVDLVYNRRDGHLYSSKPPVFTLLLAGVARLTGVWRLGHAEGFASFGPRASVYWLTLITVGLTTAAAFYVFRRKAGGVLPPREADCATALALGGTLLVAYSVSVNHHTVPAVLILASFFLLGMDEARPRVPAGRVVLAGVLMGLAAVVDIGPGVMFALGFGLYMLLYQRSLGAIVLFGLGSLPLLALHFALQHQLWGTFLPVQMIAGTKDFPFSYWHHRVGPDAWHISRFYYWLLTFFSMRGLFVLSPILLIGAAALADDIRAGLRRAPSAGEGAARPGPAYAALTVLFSVAVLVGYYSLKAPTNFGGACYGFRYYIGFTPILSWYAVRGYERWRARAAFRWLFLALGLISLAYAAVGTRYTWILMEEIGHPLVRALMPLRGFGLPLY